MASCSLVRLMYRTQDVVIIEWVRRFRISNLYKVATRMCKSQRRHILSIPASDQEHSHRTAQFQGDKLTIHNGNHIHCLLKLTLNTMGAVCLILS